MLTVLLQGCWANNPVIACDIFTRVYSDNHDNIWSPIHCEISETLNKL